MAEISIEEALKLPILDPENLSRPVGQEPYVVVITFDGDAHAVVIERIAAVTATRLRVALEMSGVPHRWMCAPLPYAPTFRARFADIWRKILLLLRGAIG